MEEGGVVTELKIRKQTTDEAEDDQNDSSDTVYILCLDESGSMSGEPFVHLVDAYNSFLSGIDDGVGPPKRIAVINFDDRARFISGPQPVPIVNAPKDLPFNGGMTNFYEPMVLVGQVIRRDWSLVLDNVLVSKQNHNFHFDEIFHY